MDNVSRRDVVAAAAGLAGLTVLGAQPGAAQEPKQEGRAANLEGSEFILKLSGIRLPREVETRIAAELQSTLMRELGRVDLKAGLALRIPNKEWLGIWIERLQKPRDLPVLRVNEVAR
jgi:hypothetical protein